MRTKAEVREALDTAIEDLIHGADLEWSKHRDIHAYCVGRGEVNACILTLKWVLGELKLDGDGSVLGRAQ